MSWEVTRELPPTRGKGRARSRRGRAGAEQEVDVLAGQAEVQLPQGSSACGPPGAAAGHACGPRGRGGQARERALARLEAQLRRAREFRAWIDAEPGRRAADLARRGGLTRARVSQILKLCRLAPEVVAAIEAGCEDWVPSERELRELAGIAGADSQLTRYRELAAGRGGPERAWHGPEAGGCRAP
jgi:hypothetical protein